MQEGAILDVKSANTRREKAVIACERAMKRRRESIVKLKLKSSQLKDAMRTVRGKEAELANTAARNAILTKTCAEQV